MGLWILGKEQRSMFEAFCSPQINQVFRDSVTCSLLRKRMPFQPALRTAFM